MSTFSCPVVRVASVENHPNADRLSIIKLEGLGYTCISANLEDGSPRYAVGDYVVYIPSASVLPEWLLKEMGFWNDEMGRGTLAGSNGDRVKPLKLRGIFSEGVLYPCSPAWDAASMESVGHMLAKEENGATDSIPVQLNGDASTFLGITKYEPPIPVHLAGEVANLFDHTIRYDFERLESVPDMFTPGELVVATEKLHGTFVAFGYVPGLNHPEMFGEHGDMIVHSKGLGAQGLVFKNNEANAYNLYVKTLTKLLEDGLEAKLAALSDRHDGVPVAILGEIFGKGVQDLHYGTSEPEFRVFEIRVGDDYLSRDELGFAHLDVDLPEYGATLGLPTVPVLYQGPFDVTELEKVRDGKTVVGGENIREGIVVRALVESHHDHHGRKVAKMISPDYLLRKAKNATEFT